MSNRVTKRLSLRKSFARSSQVHEVPNLINTQVESHKKFLELETNEQSEEIGLQAVFKSVFPIKDYNDTASLEFVSYELGEPKYDVEECHERGMTWSAPLKVTVQLVLFDVDDDGSRQIRDIKEQQVYFGEIPLMTEKGTFMVNGTERVVVSQLHRSPGVFFSHDKGKTPSGKLLYEARIIPYRGSWLDFEFDVKDILHVRIDRKRKQNASVLLRALGLSTEQILNDYHKKDVVKFTKTGLVRKLQPDLFDGFRALKDIKSKSGKVVAKAGQKFNRAVLRRLGEEGIEEVPAESGFFDGAPIAKTIFKTKANVVNPKTNKNVYKEGEIIVGWEALNKKLPDVLKTCSEEQLKEFFEGFEVIVAAGELIEPDVVDSKGKLKTAGTLQRLRDEGIEEVELLFTKESHIGESLIKTVTTDGLEPERDDLVSHFLEKPSKDALIEIYKRIRPGDPPRLETAETNFNNLFFNPERYDLSPVGRLKLDHKLHGLGRTADKKTGKLKKTVDKDSGSTFTDRGVLTRDDLIETVRYLLELRASSDPVKYTTDDIDHLGNRRVRSVGELIENQYRVGLVRMERAIKERMSIQDIETLMPQDLINYKPVSAIVKEFYGSSPLSQFMDQTNPLSEVTHKRRLSALGPGGLTRERAGFEVRDVHPTHYGRVCPIETPEGPNIGLISSLASYARVNAFGFVESPYRVVNKGKVTDEVVYLSAMEEGQEVIAQANAEVDAKGKFTHDYVSARKNNDFIKVPSEQVTLIDVSPSQLVSVAASMIPFLEHDDANRALMGSNMQRQAVPLLKTSAPTVGTGMERTVARDSGATIVAKRAGTVQHVDANRIIVKADKWIDEPLDTGVDIYNLSKYMRSNQNTCINQRPVVQAGDHIQANEVIADGQSTDKGELALGKNTLVAFMPWGGYNFEDSILVSEKVVQEDVFTSIHIEEFECVARDTKLGSEEITRDIPNVGEDALNSLDESGIISIGSEVRAGDILVGKVTPKSETQLSPEEKLLRAIFGEKAGEVRDTSMRLPPGVEGTVIDAHVFSRKGTTKDERMLEIEKNEIDKLEQDQRDEIRILRESAIKQLLKLLDGKPTTAKLTDEGRKQIVEKGRTIDRGLLTDIPFEYLRDLKIGDSGVEKEVERIVVGTGQLINNKRAHVSAKISRLKQGDELPPGVIKMVKVFVAVKRRLSVGDKMAGRHGNKGVLSRILPVEDMPYLPDGTPVDMVLNPLGVPSRMNIGQVLETHLGWANYNVGKRISNLIEQVADVRTQFSRRLREQGDKEQVGSVAGEVREILSELHKGSEVVDMVKKLDDVEVLELGKKDVGGVKIGTPVFEGATEEELRAVLRLGGVSESAQTDLYDGRSGEKFSEPVTVGVMYMLKLHHLVDDKIHARSIGPYSLVTQQPLGGKAQFGGQRLGEMEVWALEAYGAAFALQEFLTVKSDDVAGRTRMYESIVKGEHVLEPGLPESFNVMCKELKSLGLQVELIERETATVGLSEDEDDPISAELARLAASVSNEQAPRVVN